MVARNVQIPMYQAKIPIRGGGGISRMDLTERPQANPIIQALQQIMQLKSQIGEPRRQQEQDVLGKRLIEARIGQMEQPKQPSMKIVVGDGKTWLVNPQTGEKRDLGIPAPQGKVGDRDTSDIINDISKISTQREGVLSPEIEEALRSPLIQELLGKLGLEEYEEETPAIDRQWPLANIPAGTKKAYRKKVESREVPTTPITEALTATGKKPDYGYDYEAAKKAGLGPDEKGHWPSQFKPDTSAERYIDGLDTKTASLQAVINTYTKLARQQLGPKATPEQIAKKAKFMAKAKGWKIE